MQQPAPRQHLNGKPDSTVRWGSSAEPDCPEYANLEGDAGAGASEVIESVSRSALQHNPLLGTMLAEIRVSVVVPALNEAPNLPHVLPRIPAWVHEVLLVDGHSTDDTIVVARRILPDIIIVHQEGRGKGAALRSGFQAASGEIIVMIDADGSTDPGEIPLLVGALLAGADLVKGSRFVQGGGTSDMTTFRKFGHWFLLQAVRTLFGGNYSDLCYGYSAFWKRVLPNLALDGTGFEIETLINVRALKAGLRIAEVPSFEHDRIHGLSNLRALPDGWRILKTIAREWLEHRHMQIESNKLLSIRSNPSVLAQQADTLEHEVGGSQ